MSVIAVYNMKGGVGKTTTAINLSYLCAAAGQRTLLWDLDPQAASSFAFRIRPHVPGFRKRRLDNSDVFAEAIKQTDYDGLDLLPADFAYRKLDRLLARLGNPERVMSGLLGDVARGYDVVVLDCPPGMSLLTEGVFAAADLVLVPTIPTILSLRTLSQLIAWTGRGDRTPDVVAFLSMVDRRKALHRRACDWSTRHPELFLSAQVRYASSVEQMAVRRMPLPAFAPDDLASAAFASIRTEVSTRLSRAPEPDATTPSAPALLVREIELLIAGLEFESCDETPPACGVEWAPKGVHVTHEFDTADGDLARRGYVLQLHELSGKFRLVVAQSGRVDEEAPPDLFFRAQVQIDARWATGILSGLRSPLDAIERRSSQPLSPLVCQLRTIVGERPLRRVDSRLAECTWADGDRPESAAGDYLVPGAPARAPGPGRGLDDLR
jgi:chromosome partitioning protein